MSETEHLLVSYNFFNLFEFILLLLSTVQLSQVLEMMGAIIKSDKKLLPLEISVSRPALAV